MKEIWENHPVAVLVVALFIIAGFLGADVGQLVLIGIIVAFALAILRVLKHLMGDYRR